MSRVITYRPKPLAFAKGSGAHLFDDKDNKYLDCISGIGACSLGHNHPNLTNAIIKQASKFIHCGNGYTILAQQELAERLCTLANMEQIFFCNSGAEAVEAALKCLKLYANQRKIKQPKIITMHGGFHGRTYGALSASKANTRVAFEPAVPGFIHIPYNDIQAVTELTNDHDIVGILLEPIQGENGIIIPQQNYLPSLRTICDENNWLLAIDEVQSGIARTGKIFEYLHHNIQPDIVMSAKGLGGGFPIGACLMSNAATNLLTFGLHGSTFGGNPLACEAGLAVLATIEQEQLCANATFMGKYIAESLKSIFNPNIETHNYQLTQSLLGQIIEVRNKGLMLAIELTDPCKEIVDIGIKHHILLNVTAEKIVRLLPPLIIKEPECNELIDKLVKTLIAWDASKAT